MSKRTTKATAKAAIRKFAASIDPRRIEVDSERVTIWFSSNDRDRRKAQRVIRRIARHCGAPTVESNGSKMWVHYKREAPRVYYGFCDAVSA